MERSFWKAMAVFVAAYAAAVWIGFRAGINATLLAVPAFQIACALVAAVRIVQVRREGGHKQDAPLYDRQSYGFWLGGLVASSGSLAVLVALTQAV